jgi:hypothetical protein
MISVFKQAINLCYPAITNLSLYFKKIKKKIDLKIKRFFFVNGKKVKYTLLPVEPELTRGFTI